MSGRPSEPMAEMEAYLRHAIAVAIDLASHAKGREPTVEDVLDLLDSEEEVPEEPGDVIVEGERVWAQVVAGSVDPVPLLSRPGHEPRQHDEGVACSCGKDWPHE